MEILVETGDALVCFQQNIFATANKSACYIPRKLEVSTPCNPIENFLIEYIGGWYILSHYTIDDQTCHTSITQYPIIENEEPPSFPSEHIVDFNN